MNKFLKYVLVGMAICFFLPAYADSCLDTNLRWQYYESYRYSVTQSRINLLDCTLTGIEGSQNEFLWKQDSIRDYRRDAADCFFNGYVTPSQPLRLREENNKVYLILTPEYAQSKGLYEVAEEGNGDTIVNYPGKGDDNIPSLPAGEYNRVYLEEELPVLLYDFDAKIGDRYQTLLYGHVFNMVTVIGTSFREDILGGVKEIRILADFSINRFSPTCNPEDEALSGQYDSSAISCLEKIGNITQGTFTEISPHWYRIANGTSMETGINNIFDSSGNIVYEGSGFDPEEWLGSGISHLVNDQSEKVDKRIFDLHGREVTNPLPGSIYIRNGRKFVGK